MCLFLGRLLPKVPPPHVRRVHGISWEQLVNQRANLLSGRGRSVFSVQGTDFPRRGLSESRPPTPTPWVADPGNLLTCAVRWVHSPWAPGSPGAITLGAGLL